MKRSAHGADTGRNCDGPTATRSPTFSGRRQIMAGKLTGRGMNSPVRDLIDIAVCAKADPEALEIAVNPLSDEDADSILKIYELTSAQYANEARDLEVTAPELKPLCENPAPHARNAILDAKYREMMLRTTDGTAETATRTRFGERRRRFRTAEELDDGMERHGFNGFLQAQYRDHEAVLEDTKDCMRDRRDAVVTAVRPGSLDYDRIDIPEIAWSPPDSDAQAPDSTETVPDRERPNDDPGNRCAGAREPEDRMRRSRARSRRGRR